MNKFFIQTFRIVSFWQCFVRLIFNRTRDPRITRQDKLKKAINRCFFFCGYLGVDIALSSDAKVVPALDTLSVCSVNEESE